MSDFDSILANVFLFFLIFGLSGTVDFSHFKEQIKNRRAIVTGLFLQFVCLPFFGFLVVKITGFDYVMGITLLIITSSPGGAYSNWFCSMFNADLALSVTMTAISTILSIAMLPLNILIYSRALYGGDILDTLDWNALGISLAVVVTSITCGLFLSAKFGSKNPNMQLFLNKLGNVAGLALIIFTSVTGGGIDIRGREPIFYYGTILPIIFGLVTSIVISTFANLEKPERVTVAVECVYQNTGIAMSSVLALFDGDDLKRAKGVPFWYTGQQTLFVGVFCIVAWKMGWSKAPANENFIKVLLRTYEVSTDTNTNNTNEEESTVGNSVTRDLDLTSAGNRNHDLTTIDRDDKDDNTNFTNETKPNGSLTISPV